MIDSRARIRAVIVNFNGGFLLERAVRSLLDSGWTGPLDIVVVDNDSNDDSLAAIESLAATDSIASDDGPTSLSILRRPTNEGFAANNHGFADLIGLANELGLDLPEAVLLLNPDAALRPGTLGRLAEVLSIDDRVGCAAPKIIFDQPFVDIVIADGDVTISGVRAEAVDVTGRCLGVGEAFRLPGKRVPVWRCPSGSAIRVPTQRLASSIEIDLVAKSRGTIGSTFADGAQILEIDPPHRSRQIVQNVGSALDEAGFGVNLGFARVDGEVRHSSEPPFWCGAAALLHADYLRDVGGFDESFFLYYEDTDLGLRGLAKGWRTRFVDDAVVEHRHSDRTTQGAQLVEVLQHRNRLLMLARNAPIDVVVKAYARACLTPPSLVASAARSPAGVRPNLRLAGWRLRSLAQAIRGVPDAFRGRRVVHSTRQVSARQVYRRATDRR